MPVVRFERKSNTATAVAAAPERFIWDEVWEMFKRSRESGNYGANKPAQGRTVRNYQWDFDRFISFLREQRKVYTLAELRTNDVEEYVSMVQRRVKKGEISQASGNCVFRSMKALFNFMKLHPETRRLLKEMDMDFHGLLPKIPKNPPRPYVPSQEVVKKFLETFDKNSKQGLRDYTVGSLIASTGLRIGEVCALEVCDVDFKTGQIMVPEVEGQTKTGKRSVPLSVSCAEVLEHWIASRESFVRPGIKNLFVTQYGFPCNQHAFVQSFESHRSKTGLGITKDGNLSPHTLRHFFCTMYLVAGGQIQNLQYITGHEQLETLMVYVHIAKELSHVMEEHRRVDPLAALGMYAPGKKRRNR